MNNREQAARLELHTIRQIPLDHRHGRARDLFTIWFGTNLHLLAIVTGGLAVTAYGLTFGAAVAATVIGNLLGAVFMALHAAQGPRLGVPQMVQTRGQFGSWGSLLVVGIVIVMYVGFVASNLVTGGEALASLVPGTTATPGIVLGTVLGVVAAIYGHDLIHACARTMTYVSGILILITLAWIVWVHGLPADWLTRGTFSPAGFLGTVSTGALWQLSYAPYVSDYTRYMPRDTGPRPAFWASYWGCTLGSILPMVLGILVGLTLTGKGNLVAQLALLTGAIAPLVLIVFSLGIAASNALNLYCAALCVLSFGQTLRPSWSPAARARLLACIALGAAALAAALMSKDAFLANYEDFILLLLYVLVPWTAINLVDYYLLRHGDYDVGAFLAADGGIYGRFNVPAVGCYLFGIVVQLPFVANPLYTGPVARALGGIDLSWIVGLIATAPVYYGLGKRFHARHEPNLAPPVQVPT